MSMDDWFDGNVKSHVLDFSEGWIIIIDIIIYNTNYCKRLHREKDPNSTL